MLLKQSESAVLATSPNPLAVRVTWVSRRDSWDLASKVLFIVLALLILTTFVDYGVTWDEPVQHFYGGTIVRYYVSLLHGHLDKGAMNAGDLVYYGGFFDTLAVAINGISPLGRYETRHLLNALIGLIGIIGCWRVGRLLGGSQAGFWAATLLVLTPRYYGQMFNNPKDIPFAVGYIWALYYLLRALPHLPRVPRDIAVKLGIAIGLALGVRVGGLLLPAYVLMVVGLYGIFVARSKAAFAGLVKFTLTVVAIAWPIMLLCWPWAQMQPLTRPFEALSHVTRFPWFGSVLFDGESIPAVHEPRTYILRWLSISLPEIVLLLAAVGLVCAVVLLFRKGTYTSVRNHYWMLLGFGTVFPLLYVVVRRPILYDADRHFVYVVPPLVCLCALVLARGLEWARSSSRMIWAASLLAIAGYSIWQISVMIRLHPDEYVYFNQTIGGLKGASGKFETDYWGNSYKEAVKDLIQYLQTNEPQGRYTVMAASRAESSSYFFPSWIRFTKNPEEADFVISTTRYGIDEILDGPVLLTVKRLGVPLAVVKDRRQLKGIPVPGWPPVLAIPE